MRSAKCPRCGHVNPDDARFCESCGQALAQDVVVEVETNRPYVLNHASQLRFRVTNNTDAPCEVALCVLFRGCGRYVEQDGREQTQHCRLADRGAQVILAFPFRGLVAGEVPVDRIGLSVNRPAPARPLEYVLPDRSLYVNISDPAIRHDAPGITINVAEMTASDIRIQGVLDAWRQGRRDEEGVGWNPIWLQPVREGERAVPLPSSLRVMLGGGATMELVRVPAGEFTMGRADGRGKDDERPPRRVRITRDFYLGAFPVTQREYQCLMGNNPSRFQGASNPVDSVSWTDAKEFCRKLRAHLRNCPQALSCDQVAAEDVTLPTEAQWEYACRAGTDSEYSFGDGRSLLGEYGWYEKNSGRTTHPVGELKPNAWGLYDVHGNVWEWCEDFYSSDYSAAGGEDPKGPATGEEDPKGPATGGEDPKGPATGEEDPKGPATGERRVLRGGSWSCLARECGSASRHSAAPDARTANYAFRVVLRVQ